MNFDPATWGTAADWVGGLGTTAAFVAAVVVIAKDAKVRKIAQARKVVYVAETATVYGDEDAFGYTSPKEVVRLVLKNLSDEPVYRVFFVAHDGLTKGQPIDSKHVILPGEEFAYVLDVDAPPPLALFRDNSDVGWVRNIRGKIHPFNNRRPQKLETYAE